MIGQDTRSLDESRGPFVRVAERFSLVREHDLTLGTFLERVAAVHGAGRRLVEEHGTGLSLTFGEAVERQNEWAAGVAAQIEPGDRVVVNAPNGFEFFLLCLAVARAGGIPVPVNPQMTASEIDYVTENSGATLAVSSGSDLVGKGTIDTAVDASPDDVAAVFYTSGTTGKPKGAELSHRALVGGIGPNTLFPAELRSHRDEAVSGMPIAHIAGFAMLLQMAAVGVPLYLLPRFRPNEALDALEQRRATAFMGVPAMYRMMVEAGAEQRDLKSVRLWASGADAMPDDLRNLFRELGAAWTLPFVNKTIGKATFLDGYGMVELAGGVAVRAALPFAELPLMPMPGYKLKAVDEQGNEVGMGQVGELVVKGRGVLKGYHGNEEATREIFTEDGFMRTGDLAKRGPLGTISLAGRIKHVIKHGGYSVFAVEVEHTLEEHPAIAEAAVIGLPDERKGEIPAAVVRVNDGQSITEGELIDWAKAHMAEYKVPRRVRVVDELPRTGTQKVQKNDLKKLFEEQS
jgi:long-chain acyl-CoA synthetase